MYRRESASSVASTSSVSFASSSPSPPTAYNAEPVQAEQANRSRNASSTSIMYRDISRQRDIDLISINPQSLARYPISYARVLMRVLFSPEELENCTIAPDRIPKKGVRYFDTNKIQLLRQAIVAKYQISDSMHFNGSTWPRLRGVLNSELRL